MQGLEKMGNNDIGAPGYLMTANESKLNKKDNIFSTSNN